MSTLPDVPERRIAAMQARADALRNAGELGAASDATVYPGQLLLAVSRPGACTLLQIPDWDWRQWRQLAEQLGFELTAPAQPTAMQRALSDTAHRRTA